MKIFKKIKSKFKLLGILGTLKFIFKSEIFNVKNTQYKRMLNRNSKSDRFHEIYKNIDILINNNDGSFGKILNL